ncbi:MAG: HAD family hydrolase [Catenulispora sp.]
MTGPRIAAVAFDLDGTLVDLEALQHEAWLRAAREAEVELTWEQAFQRLPHFVGGPDAAVAAEIAALSPSRSSAAVLAAKQRYFTRLISSFDEITPRAGVPAVVDLLATRGLPMAVATVTEREIALALLRRAGLLPFFGAARVIAAQDMPRLKPAPDAYRATAKRLGVRPEDQLVFEDSITGITSARSAGCPVVAMPTVRELDYLERVRASGVTALFQSWHDPDLTFLLERLISVGGPASRSPEGKEPARVRA